ncbi:MAG: type II toxin-antitoxin system PemK/MazF family toxin [Acidobacteriota bacterium]
MNRGDIIIGAPQSPFNKPRPALVVQDRLQDFNETVLVAPITSDLEHIPGVRVPIVPTGSNGLRKPSEVMIDLLQPLRLLRIGAIIGKADDALMLEVDAALRLFLRLP